MQKEGLNWNVKTILEKRDGDINTCESPEERLRWLEDNKPYETSTVKGNLLLDDGMDLLLSLLTGQGGDAYATGTAEIGVSDDDTAAVRTQDLLDTTEEGEEDWQGMEENFPTAPAENDATDGRSVKFKSSWGADDGNFAWKSWGIRNKAVAGTILNRKVESLGTKATGTWTLAVEISLS